MKRLRFLQPAIDGVDASQVGRGQASANPTCFLVRRPRRFHQRERLPERLGSEGSHCLSVQVTLCSHLRVRNRQKSKMRNVPAHNRSVLPASFI